MLIAPVWLLSWDFWTVSANDNGLHHIFFLQAPRDDHNPEARHNMASVGHAVSRDLDNWEYRGVAIERGVPGSWNDLAIWTGSALKTKMGDYVMMVTGRSSRDGGTVQRLGIYFSPDLYSWKEYDGNPVLECDPSIYHPHHHEEHTTTWRDPFLFYDSGENIYKAYVTAQKIGAAGEIIGCIAVANSQNLIDWVAKAPLDIPDYFRVMECPQLVFSGDSKILLIHIDKKWILDSAPDEVQRITGTHYLISEDGKGSYRYGGVLLDGEVSTPRGLLWGKYQLRIHDQKENGDFRALFWPGYDKNAKFSGGISEVQLIKKSNLV